MNVQVGRLLIFPPAIAELKSKTTDGIADLPISTGLFISPASLPVDILPVSLRPLAFLLR